MEKASDCFASMVFNDKVMKDMLPSDTYEAMRMTIENGSSLDIEDAKVVANAMKNWAISKGATHFTHWFQPMTGITAEKHDSFISQNRDGTVIMEFSGKELVKGEPDASSFPSGGLRTTFEARGYTAWDPTSYAFIKDETLYIPTAFCSYAGAALDKRTPLLRSMQALNKQTMRILRLFGNTEATSVKPCVGAEQEYFLIDKELFNKRKDLILTGRTLFGASAPKGQELSDHYFGAIAPRVHSFMRELDRELWTLGVPARTEHNEVAPAQHELAPIYTTANIAADHNQLVMELMRNIAKKHGLVCLFHERPFAGLNGSGKHNNWSVVTNTGVNLLQPGETPHENAQFILFICGIIKAVDEYQDLLRISVAGAGNDHRLGANEAPPAIVSIFLGQELSDILKSFEDDCVYDLRETEKMKVGVKVIPRFQKDTTDRNRTSPLAFTGNKFEFRMVGSSDSIACANIIMNTIFAEALSQFADELEGCEDFDSELKNIIRKTIKKHKRIIFNGNGYDDNWMEEAENERGLLNLKTTPDCMVHYLDEKNVKLFAKHKVFTYSEMFSRYEIIMENYCKVLNIEAKTMIDMVRTDILPAVSGFLKKLSGSTLKQKQIFPDISCFYETNTINKLSKLSDDMFNISNELYDTLENVNLIGDIQSRAFAYKEKIVKLMEGLRECVDKSETLVERSGWPYPSYCELLFGRD